MPHPYPLPACFGLALAAFAPALCLAQSVAPTEAPTAAAPAAPAKKPAPRVKPATGAETPGEPDVAVVELSPFMVNAANDTSWAATTTLIGSRTNQELIKVPVAVDPITADFMRDIGAFSMEDAAQYVAGLTVSPRLESRNDDGRITYRGMSSSNTSRNFFLWYVPSDNYNVERYDFNKGSNSLMFGDASPGGQGTIYTKQARARDFEELFASYGSFGAYRVQLDANRALRKNLFARFNVVNRTNKTYVRGTNDNLRALDLAVTWEPFRNTTLRVEGESGKVLRTRADSALAINDVAAAGRGFSSNNRWYITSDGEIFLRTSTFPAAIDRSGASGNSVSLLAGQTRAVLLPNGTQKLFHGFDKYLDVLGTNDYLNRTYNVATVTLEQRIGKLAIEAAFNQQYQHQDRNDNSFGTSQSPPVFSVDGNGRPYVDMATSTIYKIFGNVVKAGRISAVYPFDFGRWGKQFAVVTAQRQRDVGTSKRFSIANELGPGPLGNNILQYRAYMDDPHVGDAAFWDRFLLRNLPTTPTFHAIQYETFTNTGPFVDIRYSKTYTASLSGEYFGGRLNSLVGISWNQLRRKIPGPAAYTTDARGFVTHPGMPWDNPGAYVYDPGFSLQAHSSVAGLSYAVFKREPFSLSAYAVYSESFNWQSRQVFYGPDIGPVLGKTKEFGFRGTLFGKISYWTSFYDVHREHAAYAWLPDVLSALQLEDLINPNNILSGDPRYIVPVNGLNNERRTVDSSEQSRGFELTLQGQRWHGLQSRVTFSASRVRAQPDFTQFKKYLDDARARTAAANAPGGDRSMAESATVLANAQTVYDSNTLTDKTQGRRSAPYGASFALDYDVRWVRGLRVGLNGVLTPNYNIVIFSGTAYKGAASFPLGGYVLYDTRIMKRPLNFRLGLQNAYDPINGNSPYRITGATTFNNTTQKPNYVYRYTEPVVTSFSVTARF